LAEHNLRRSFWRFEFDTVDKAHATIDNDCRNLL